MYKPHSSESVAIFIDGENIHYSAKHLNMRLDYLKMCEQLAAGRRLIRAYFYTAVSTQSEGKIDFINFLKLNGFRVVTKELKSFPDNEVQQRAVRGHLDLDLAIDVYEMLPHLDTVILCSGDGDFVRLIESVARQGKHIEVCALREMTSTDLIAASDVYIDLATLKEEIALEHQPQSIPRNVINDFGDDPIDYNKIEY